jgi:acyl-CoA thioesterase
LSSRPAQFDRDTAAEPASGGGWTARFGSHLIGFGGTHGGYVTALALRAMAAHVGDPARTPRSLTSHLLARVRPGAVQLFPRTDRTGETISSAALSMQQDGRVVATALATFGKPRQSAAYLGLAMPDVPPAAECRPLIDKPVADARAGLLVEHRPAAPPLPLSGGERAEIVVWMRLIEDRPVDAFSATMLADAAPPALYGWLTEPVAMPSMEIAIQFATLEVAGADVWLLGRFRTSYAASGYAVEDGELWAESGELLLQSRQLRRMLQRA